MLQHSKYILLAGFYFFCLPGMEQELVQKINKNDFLSIYHQTKEIYDTFGQTVMELSPGDKLRPWTKAISDLEPFNSDKGYALNAHYLVTPYGTLWLLQEGSDVKEEQLFKKLGKKIKLTQNKDDFLCHIGEMGTSYIVRELQGQKFTKPEISSKFGLKKLTKIETYIKKLKGAFQLLTKARILWPETGL